MKTGMAMLMLLGPAVAAHAHPGHPALDPAHAHGPLGLDPIAAVLWSAAIVLVGVVGARAWRRRPRAERSRRR